MVFEDGTLRNNQVMKVKPPWLDLCLHYKREQEMVGENRNALFVSHKDKDKVTAVHGAESSPYLTPGPAAPSLLSDFQHCDKFSLLLCFAL